MNKTTSTQKATSKFTGATAIHTPQLLRNYEHIRSRAEVFCAARHGMIGMTLNDWLKAEQELKPVLKKPITNEQ